MATTAATIAQWIGITPSVEEEAMLERVLAVAQAWAYDQILETAHDNARVQEAILLYAVRRYQSKDAPSGLIEQDGFQSQGFVSYRDIAELLDPYRVWNVG